MRTYALMFLTLVVAVGGFVAYLQLQTPPAPVPVRAETGALDPVEREVVPMGAIGRGNRPWISTLDDQRRLEHRIRFSDYTPRGGNRVDVTDVDAEFFQYVKDSESSDKLRTQMVRILGKTGHFEVNEAPKMSGGVSGGKSRGSKTASGPPKRGLLNDVTIQVYRHWTRDVEKQIEAGTPVPNIVATMPNLSFDNETYEIFTHDYTTPEGKYIRADEVPIEAKGDYDFKGQGMICRWNDVEGRLEYLEIARGEYLIVNDPEVLNNNKKPAVSSPASAPVAAHAAPANLVTNGPRSPNEGLSLSRPIDSIHVPLTDISGRPIVLVAKNKGLPPGSVPRAGVKHKTPPPPYRAAFDDNVRISQGTMNVKEVELARADILNVDFQSGSKSTTRPTTGPASRSATAPADTNPVSAPKAITSAEGKASTDAAPNLPRPSPASADLPATSPAEVEIPANPATLSASRSSTRPATGPATKPANEPIIIRWTGKLRLAPLETRESVPVGPGESMARLIGVRSPVQLTRDTSKVWCTTADYFSADGSALLRSSPTHGPVILWQHPDAADAAKGSAQDATIFTQELNYRGTERVAILRGDSTAHILLPPDRKPTTQPTTLPTKLAGLPATLPNTRPTEALDAKWNREGRLHFKPNGAGGNAGGSTDSLAFDHAEFEGDVDIKHPQMALKSQRLELFFEDRPRPATRPATQPVTPPAGGPVTLPASQPSTRPAAATQLKQMIATTDVWCDLTDTGGKKQTITSQRLTMTTAQDADGKLYPRIVTALGDAHAFDATQDLRAGGLEIKLLPSTRPTTRPTTRPGSPTNPPDVSSPTVNPATQPAGGGGLGGTDTAAVELQSMRAWDRVAVRNAEGSKAVSDRMNVDVINGQTVARIIGAPLATVTDPKGSSITGPIIDFDPSRDWAKVSGKGTIHAIQAEPTTKPTTRPTGSPPTTLPATQPAPKFADIFWEKDAELDGGMNRILVNGPVHIVSTDPDGTVNTADAENAVIELTDAPKPPTPATKPATRPAKSGSGPTTGPSNTMAAGAGMNMLKDKVVSAVNLNGKAIVSSTLSDAGGILKQTQIRSETLRYETGDAAGSAIATSPATRQASPMAFGQSGNGRLIAPGPGTMIYRDHRPAGTAKADPGGQPAPDQARGVTAFRWDKSMTYHQLNHTAQMLGNVRIVQQADEPQAEPVRVVSDQVDALFEPKSPVVQTGVKPATKPAAGSADTAMQLKWLTLTGHVSMERAGAVLTADRADYNPATSWLTAVGTPQTPPTYITATALDTMRADQILWNTQTWAVSAKNVRGGTGRNEVPPTPKRR